MVVVLGLLTTKCSFGNKVASRCVVFSEPNHQICKTMIETLGCGMSPFVNTFWCDPQIV